MSITCASQYHHTYGLLMSITWTSHVYHILHDYRKQFWWLSHYHMAYCEYPLGLSWVLHGLVMSITWASHKCHMGSLWAFISVTWTPREYHMGFSWISHGLLMGITWASHVYHSGFSWVSHGLLMGITWASHGYQPHGLLGCWVIPLSVFCH